MKPKTVLDTDFCKVISEKDQLTLLIKMKQGGYAVQTPYSNDVRGLIGALTLAIDVIAGKVLLTGIVSEDHPAVRQVESKQKLISLKDVNTCKICNGQGCGSCK